MNVVNLSRQYPLLNQTILMVADLLGLMGFYSLAHWIRLDSLLALDSVLLWILILVAMTTMYVMGVYRTEEPEIRSRLPLDTFVACLVVMLASMVFVYTIGVESFSPVFGRGVLPIAMVAFSIWAPFWRWLLTHWQQNLIEVLDWMVVSDKETYDMFIQDCLNEFPSMKIRWIDASVTHPVSEKTVKESNTCGVIFSTHSLLPPSLAQQLMEYRFSGMPVLTLTEFYEHYWHKVPVLHLKDGWFLQTRGFNLVHDHIGLRFKRMLDLLIALLGGLIALPLSIVLIVAIRLDSKGKALYRQNRVGLNGREFLLYKFRTMIEDAESGGVQWSQSEDRRVTRIGRFLRQSRLDELPQIWNLFKGDMSLIGPRPERPEFTRQLEKGIPYYDMRHLVSPGITGWAQVMYPYGSSVGDARKKLEYDLYYIKNHSLQLDLSIVLKTLIVVLKREGI